MEWLRLGDIADVVMGQSSLSKYTNEKGLGLPFYQGVSDFGETYPTPSKFCSNPKKIASSGDILIGVRAPVGDTNIANEDCCIGRGIAAIKSFCDKVKRNYLYYYLNFSKFYLESQSTGSTFKAINKSTLEELLIPLRNIDEQIKIESVLKQIETLI